MKRTYLIFPLLALTAFAGYYRYWKVQQERVWECSREFYDPYRYRDGHQEAVADLARGRLRVVSYGLPAHWSSEYREILLRDYRIEYQAIAGCVITQGISEYAAAYNDVMERRIATLYGPHVFDDAAAKSDTLYNERHPPFVRD
jgi:hypothetical protein